MYLSFDLNILTFAVPGEDAGISACMLASRQSNLLHLFTIFILRNRHTEWCNATILVARLFLVDHVATVR